MRDPKPRKAVSGGTMDRWRGWVRFLKHKNAHLTEGEWGTVLACSARLSKGLALTQAMAHELRVAYDKPRKM